MYVSARENSNSIFTQSLQKHTVMAEWFSTGIPSRKLFFLLNEFCNSFLQGHCAWRISLESGSPYHETKTQTGGTQIRENSR